MITNQQEESEFEPNSYSRVIFKNYNDTSTQDLLNSYRYAGSRNQRFKKWKPDISPEERFKKKRDREDKYVNDFHPDDRPVLLVQEKHQYKGVENPNVFVDPAQREAYYKVSENTQSVDDITDEIKQLESFIRRHTLVHKPRVLPEDENLSSIFKVEGKEFLPEGFIELDPLLLKDEYEFESEADKQQFDEEQRRLKMLRRKQYEQRNDNKIRDVTIYVMDEQKNKALMFLEKWEAQHRRKMNAAELEYVAKSLGVPKEKLQRLQALYFKKQELLKGKGFDDSTLRSQSPLYLREMPQGIKGQFQKKRFDQVDSRYMKTHEPYVPTFLNKYQKKPLRPKAPVQTSNSVQQKQLLDTKALDDTLQKSLEKKNYRQKEFEKPKNQSVNQKFSQSGFQGKQNQKQKVPNYEQFAENQDFSKTAPIVKNGNFDSLQDPFEKMLNNEKNLKNSNSQAQQEQIENNKSLAQQQKRPSFENDLQKYFDNEINDILNKIKGTPENEVVKKSPVNSKHSSKEYINSFKQKLIKEDQNLKDLVDRKHSIQAQQIAVPKLPKRHTTFSHKAEGPLIVTHKLKPIAIGNEFFYQTVEHTLHPDGSKEAVLTTKNDQGQILTKFEIPNSKIGKFYQNEVFEKSPDFKGDQGKLVKVFNDSGEEVHQQVLRPRVDQLQKKDLETQLENENFKKEVIQNQGDITTHNLNPISYNGKIYRQVVEELALQSEPFQQVNVLTYDEHNEILKNVKADSSLKTETYYSEIIPLNADSEQNAFQLVTKNNKGEIIAEYELENKEIDFKEKYLNNQTTEQNDEVTILNLNPVVVGDRILKQEIHLRENRPYAKVKTFNDFDAEINEEELPKELITKQAYSELENREDKLILQTKDSQGQVIAEFELPDEYSDFKNNQQFDEIVEIVDSEGLRRATVAIKATPEQQFRSYQLRPTLIGNQFYQQTVNELISSDSQTQPKAVLITKDENGEVLQVIELNPDQVATDYYNQIVDETIDEAGRRKATILTLNNEHEEIGRVEISQSLASKFGKEHYEEVIEELVNENENQEEEIDLVKMDKDEEGKFEVNQLHLNPEEVRDLQGNSREEYFQRLLNLFGNKNPRRSFQKDVNDFAVRPKAHTYARIPADYQDKSFAKLTDENKNQIDQFMMEVEESHQKEKLAENKAENIEQFIEENKIKEEEEEKTPVKKSTIKDRSNSRLKSKSRYSKKNKDPMSFEELEKKRLKLEQKKQKEQQEQQDENRTKKTSVVEKEFKPSIISKLYEERYGGQVGSEKFANKEVEVRAHSQTVNPLQRDIQKQQVQSEEKNEQQNQSKDKINSSSEEELKKESSKVIIKSPINEKEEKSSSSSSDEEEKKSSKKSFKNSNKSKKDLSSSSSSDKEEKNKSSSSSSDDEEKQEKRKQKISAQEVSQIDDQEFLETEQKVHEKMDSEKKIESKKSLEKRESVKKGKHTELLEDKEKLKNYFDDFIDKDVKDEDLQNIEQDEMKQKLSNVIENQEKKDSKLIQKLMDKTGQSKEQLLDDFYKFCKTLQKDDKYKESVLFATLFYYYLDKKRRSKTID